MRIISRFRILLAEKETREHRRISLQKVSDETSISIYTIKKLNSDDLREFPMEAMNALCQYFDCTPGELFTQEGKEAYNPRDKSARPAMQLSKNPA